MKIFHFCKECGIHMPVAKTTDVCQTIEFWGNLLDITQCIVHLPPSKVDNACQDIYAIIAVKKTTLNKIQDVVDTLNFASCVIQVGWKFLRRMIDLTFGKSNPNHHTWLTEGDKSDLKIWLAFLGHYKGRTWISLSPISKYTISSDSDQYGVFRATFRTHFIQGICPST